MREAEPRLSIQTLKVLTAFLRAPRNNLSGADIGRETKLASGTLYPILLRLEEAGWLHSRWEEQSPHTLKRPRRRMYQITAIGEKKALNAFHEVEMLKEAFA